MKKEMEKIAGNAGKQYEDNKRDYKLSQLRVIEKMITETLEAADAGAEEAETDMRLNQLGMVLREAGRACLQ